MSKYFFGNPAEIGNRIYEKSQKELRDLDDRIKREDITLIKYYLSTGLNINDPEVQFQMEISGVTKEDLGL